MKKIYLLFSAILFSLNTFAQQPHQQLSDGGSPWSYKFDQFDNQIVNETMPAIDVAGLMYEDSMTALQTKPYRFGYDHMVNFNLSNSGSIITLDNGDKIWRLGIKAPDATSMSLSFQNMNLPEGCKLFVFDSRRGQMYGAFTQKHVTPEDKMLGTELLYADHIIVELFIPNNEFANTSLEIWRVTQGYVDFGETIAKAFGGSGSCQNNARCPAYATWDDQIRSGICLVNGGEFCSAALINNTCNDGTPYVLTANHCGSSGFGSWVFRFNWEASGCTNPGSSPSSNSISGGVQRAANPGSDMSLIEMNSTPPAGYNVYYAGWDRSNTTPTNMFGVHHPSGDIKKFSQSTGNGTTVTTGGATCWQTGTWTDGVTEPGSSGSPIFNSSGLIVGQLYGGPSDCSCENNAGCGYDYYGKVFTSWTGGGTSASRLSDWLEPAGCTTGSSTQIGFDPNTPTVTLDAAITIINVPADGISSCETDYTPEAVLRNYGSNTLTSCTINYSLDGAGPLTQAWTGSLATGASTTITLPAISVAAGPHTYMVSSSNPNGSTDLNTANDSQTNSFTVTASPAGTPLPFTQGFDTNPFVPTGWTLTTVNQLNAANTWSRQTTASGFGNSTAAARMDNFSGGTEITGQLDRLTTPSLDFSTATAPIDLDFSVAYARYNTTRSDSLIVLVSTDCGLTYTRVFADGGNTLATAPVTTAAFTPSSAQWSARNINMDAYAGEPSVYVRFESKSNWGNNIWLDDINLYYTNVMPVADFSADDVTPCVGQTVTFTDLTTNSPTSWSWTITGPATFNSSVQNPSFVFTTPGTYQVELTATNASGSDTETKVGYITVTAAPTLSNSNTPASCNGVCDGTATVSASGGTPGYTYQWNAAAGSQTTATATSLCDGSYSVVVTDGNNCTANTSVTVTEPTVLTITSVSTTQSACASNTGTATVNVTGGTTAYSYTLDAGTPQASNSYTGLAAGSYTMLVADANDCQATTTFTITNPNSPTATNSSTPTLCIGSCDGTGTVNISGGTSPYSVDWCGNNTQTGVTGSTTNNSMCAGTCLVTITDAAGCTTTQSVTVSAPSAISASTAASATSCNGVCDGGATVTITGGAAPYTVNWCSGTTNTNVSIMDSETGLCAGSCSVTITDANGCSTNQSVTISSPSTVSASMTPTAALCNGDCNGQALVNISGGTAPYTVDWCDASQSTGVSSVATNNTLCAGSCSVTITDNNGCTTTASATVTEPTALSSSETHVDEVNGNDGSINLTITGGTGPYNVSWSSGQNTEDISGLAGGVYTATITDANGCVTTQVVTVGSTVGISENALENINVYPNPNTGAFVIELPVNNIETTVEIYDVQGKLIYQSTLTSDKNNLDLGLATGMYNLRIKNANGMKNHKLMIQK